MPNELERLKAALADRYHVERELARGGMAIVYLARDLKHDRLVALKVLNAELAASLGAERFLREVSITARLNHPHVLPLLDSGEAESFLYFVMPYADGETLRDPLNRERQLPFEDALQITRQVADALSYAHSHDVVHRDIKPENILLASGHALVADFGIARAITAAGGEQLTATGMAVGTATYMSPEQVTGDRVVDGRADIYSLACVTYEMLGGAPPFTGPTAQAVMARHVVDPMPSVRTIRPSLSHEVDRVLAKGLAKVPADRFATAVQFAQGLEHVGALGEQAAPSTIPSVAVLPFVNMSTDPENEYFCDGLAEELISALSKIDRLRVASRTSTFSLRSKGLDVREIGSALNVGAVLEGSVRKAGTRLRITTQLVNVSDGYHLWSERYDRQLEDIFQVQDDIALAIVGALKVKLLGEEQAAMAKRPTLNVEAYQFYLKGRHHWQKWTAEELQKARECFQRAIELDPKFALAYFGLADVFAVEGFVTTPPREAWPKAKTALTKALALDQELAEAWTLTGVYHMVYEWNQPTARAALMRALEVDPRLGHAYAVLAQVEIFSGRPDDAVAAGRRPVELDPLVANWNYILAWVYWAQGDYDRASHQLQVLREIDPTSWFPHFGSGIVAGAVGKREEAIGSFEEAVRCSGGSPYAVGYLACAYAVAKRRVEAERQLATLHERAQHGWVPALGVAIAHLGLGAVDRAFEWLERAYEERDLWLLFHTYDPIFQDIRADPRMIDLRRRLGVPE